MTLWVSSVYFRNIAEGVDLSTCETIHAQAVYFNMNSTLSFTLCTIPSKLHEYTWKP